MSELELLAQIRHLYGDTYLTVFPDGFHVSWRTLTLGEFLSYSSQISRDLFPRAVFEDEIFSKCVKNDALRGQREHLKAGIITSVVDSIWEFSVPASIDQVRAQLDVARQEVYQSEYALIHDFVNTILLAFPYKPEEIYKMDYEQLIKTLVMAERKLIELGLRKEPISIVNPAKPEEVKKSPIKVDAKALWEQQHGIEPKPKDPFLPQDAPTPTKSTKGKWYKKSPVLEAPPTHNVKVGEEDPDIFTLTGWDQADLGINRAMMVQDAQVIYRDVLEGLARKKKRQG